MSGSSRREVFAAATILSAWAASPALSRAAPAEHATAAPELACGALTASRYGAVGDGSADDTSALQAAINASASLGATLRMDSTSKTYLAISGLSLPDHASISDGKIAAGAGASTDHAIVVAGTGVSIAHLTISTRSNTALSAAANSGLVAIEGLRIGSPVSEERGHGLRIDAGGHAYWSLSDSLINVSGYGVLTGTRKGGPGNVGLRIVNTTIFAAADGIEINAPHTAETNFIVANNLLETHGVARPSSGFAFGVAHGQGFVFSGNVVQQSTAEAIHIEDGSQFGVFSGFVARQTCSQAAGAERSAINHYASGPNRSESGPIVFVGFALENANHGSAAHSCGYRALNNDGQGIVSRSPIVAGYFHGYESGLFFSGRGVIPLGYLSIESCYYALRLSNGAEAYNSTLYSKGAKTFLQSNGGGAAAGFFHEESSTGAPTIILATPAGVMGSTVEGFSCGVTTPIHPGENVIALFEAPRRMRGVLTLRGQGATGWYFWEGEIVYDGLALNIDGGTVIMENHGSLSPSAPVISLANHHVQARVKCTAGSGDKVVTRINFRGTYYN